MVESAVALILTGTALIINATVNNNSLYMHIIGAALTVAGVLLVFFGTKYFQKKQD